ncbi:MAG: polysaccharide deacetylase family protein [Burkholderiales bacterium]
MLKTLLAASSGAGARARLSVLIFHRVLPEPDPLFPGEIDAVAFRAICGWLAAWCQVLPLTEAMRRLAEGTLPPRACAITFDDGYADNHSVALPILQAHGLSATFFVATGFLNGGRMWNDTVIESLRRTERPTIDLHELPGDGAADSPIATVTSSERRSAIDQLLQRLKYLPIDARVVATERLAALAQVVPPADLMMTTAQLRGLHAAGMTIGAHTVSHPILARLDRAAAQSEIKDGKAALEAMIDAPVTLFAYPNGKPGTDYSAETIALARAVGFDAAFSTAWGTAQRGGDRFQVPRFTPWDRTRVRFGMRMVANLRRRGTVPALLSG